MVAERSKKLGGIELFVVDRIYWNEEEDFGGVSLRELWRGKWLMALRENLKWDAGGTRPYRVWE